MDLFRMHPCKVIWALKPSEQCWDTWSVVCWGLLSQKDGLHPALANMVQAARGLREAS